jgi:hypothetical protein
MHIEITSSTDLKQHVTASIFSAISALGVAVTLSIAWLCPQAFDDPMWVNSASNIVLLEFITLFAGATFASHSLSPHSRISKNMGIVILTLFYLPFVGVFGYLSGGLMVVTSYTVMLTARVWTLFTTNYQNRKLILIRSLVNLGVLMVLLMIFASIPVPRFGITNEISAEIITAFRQQGIIMSGGFEKGIATGVLYFFLLAVFEIYIALGIKNSSK